MGNQEYERYLCIPNSFLRIFEWVSYFFSIKSALFEWVSRGYSSGFHMNGILLNFYTNQYISQAKYPPKLLLSNIGFHMKILLV
jgi:hypothetical protein